jgi:hypothetical protein
MNFLEIMTQNVITYRFAVAITSTLDMATKKNYSCNISNISTLLIRHTLLAHKVHNAAVHVVLQAGNLALPLLQKWQGVIT